MDNHSGARSTRRRSALLVGVAAIALGACSVDTSTSGGASGGGNSAPDTTTVPGGGAGRSFSPYRAFTSCDDLLEWTRARMLERVTPWGLGGGWWGWGGVDAGFDAMESGRADGAPVPTAAPSDAPTAAPGSGDGGTSGTNTQEAGVDEGDLVETDGRYLYTVHDGALRSVDLDTATVVAKLDLPQGDHRIILSGDGLVAITQSWSGSSASTIVSEHTVADGVPTLLGRTHLEGSVLASRGFDDTVRVVLRHDIVSRIPFVYPTRGGEDAEERALAENRRIIGELTADQLLPRSFGESPAGARATPSTSLGCADVGVPGDYSGFGLTWIASLDAADEEATMTGEAGVIADAQTVYASSNSLYVATIRYDDVPGDVAPVRPEPPSTNFHAFDLRATGGAAYLATGNVEGTVINQYALSEHAGHLRVATTTEAGGFGDERDSGVHVLRRDGTRLVEVGAVRGLGLGESIQGVRFQGDTAYVVTFRQIDPLYVLDLSDPAAPEMLGELKIPGFSTYLHPVGGEGPARDGLLVGVGFAGTDDGIITGAQLSLFDVADQTAPALLDTVDLGWSSEATFDPLAFLWWAPTGDVIVPGSRECIGAFPGVGRFGGGFSGDLGCGNAVVARIEGDALVRRGEIAHWFPIRRTLIAQGRLVSVSADSVRIWDLDTLTETALVDLGVEPGTFSPPAP
jgi:hypothetical protein